MEREKGNNVANNLFSTPKYLLWLELDQVPNWDWARDSVQVSIVGGKSLSWYHCFRETASAGR